MQKSWWRLRLRPMKRGMFKVLSTLSPNFSLFLAPILWPTFVSIRDLLVTTRETLWMKLQLDRYLLASRLNFMRTSSTTPLNLANLESVERKEDQQKIRTIWSLRSNLARMTLRNWLVSTPQLAVSNPTNQSLSLPSSKLISHNWTSNCSATTFWEESITLMNKNNSLTPSKFTSTKSKLPWFCTWKEAQLSPKLG